MWETLIDELTQLLRDRVLTTFGHAVDRVVLQPPPRLPMGDLATPIALDLAKALKKSPRQIAEQLAKDFPLPQFVSRVTVEGAGYLNFHLDRSAFTAAYMRE